MYKIHEVVCGGVQKHSSYARAVATCAMGRGDNKDERFV